MTIDEAKRQHDAIINRALEASRCWPRIYVNDKRRGTCEGSVKRTLVLSGDMLVADVETKAVTSDGALDYVVMATFSPGLFHEDGQTSRR